MTEEGAIKLLAKRQRAQTPHRKKPEEEFKKQVARQNELDQEDRRNLIV